MDYYYQDSAPGATGFSYPIDVVSSSSMRRTFSENTDKSTDSAGSWPMSEYPSQISPVSVEDSASSQLLIPHYDYDQDMSHYDVDHGIPYYDDNRDMSYHERSQNTGGYLMGSSQHYDDSGQIFDYSPHTNTVQLFDSEEMNKEVAKQATIKAQEHLRRNQNGRPKFSIITNEKIEQELKQHSTVSAVTLVLQQYLSRHLEINDLNQVKVTAALQEAACQLQLRVSSKGAQDKCYHAIVNALDRFRNKQDVMPSITQPESEDRRFLCEFQGCQGAFGRQADLDRHDTTVHKAGNRFLCDYRRCGRHELHFKRKDHFRDHFREYHKEDLPRRGAEADRGWWESRIINKNWWRCNNCLVTRVYYETDGWVCPDCSMQCQTERQRYRLELYEKKQHDTD